MTLAVRLAHLPIRKKILVAIIGTSFIAVVISTLVFVVYGWNALMTKAEAELETNAAIFAENVSAAVSFGDVTAAERLLSSLRALHQLSLACVYSGIPGSDTGILFAQYKPETQSLGCPRQSSELVNLDNALTYTKEITVDGEWIGSIYLQRSMTDLNRAAGLSAVIAVLMVCISIMIAYGLSSFFRELIEVPIMNLVDTTQRVSEGHNFSIRANKTSDDEIGILYDSFNEMLEQIEARDLELGVAQTELEARLRETAEANKALQETLSRLKETQEQLVQQEKMASLGSLVAGVAHEVNTPIGVGVTAASTLHSATVKARADYDAGSLTNSGLRRYMESAIQSSEILLTNLERAAGLVRSFKQVAVDQTSSEARRYDLREYINEIMLSLAPKIRKTQIQVIHQVPEDISMFGYPGAISQTITNLVMNSLVHAFPEGESGHIELSAKAVNGDVEIEYRDDGVGLDESSLHKVFDPFFTTKRGAGGSGLGMHIVYNLVTQKLKGHIKLDSKPGAGFHVWMRIPRDIPEQEVA